ncbi:hypothetical protein [Brevibacillus laterosporus]|nr:hypothetical protein [Brevibacillus laterosporus]MDN9012754.1 hypothetical protein [Brevibacillus laterosporus]MDO0943821.1 hypothetical protein [Brevibacillus laterosporus]
MNQEEGNSEAYQLLQSFGTEKQRYWPDPVIPQTVMPKTQKVQKKRKHCRVVLPTHMGISTFHYEAR